MTNTKSLSLLQIGKILLLNFRRWKDWLYEEGEDETKGVYVAKLEELKKVRSFRDNRIPARPPCKLQNCM